MGVGEKKEEPWVWEGMEESWEDSTSHTIIRYCQFSQVKILVNSGLEPMTMLMRGYSSKSKYLTTWPQE